MTTCVAVADWIKRLADEERRRDAVRDREEEIAAKKADFVRVHGGRLIENLRAAVSRDVEAYRQEFPQDAVRELFFEDGQPDGGFVVRKPGYPAASLHVSPRLGTAAVGCHYRFTPSNGLPPREDRLELVFAGEAETTLQMKHLGTGHIFDTADALSEYLLMPVFTGRPR